MGVIAPNAVRRESRELSLIIICNEINMQTSTDPVLTSVSIGRADVQMSVRRILFSQRLHQLHSELQDN